MCPSGPRRFARSPVERRAAGTGLSARKPLITAYSNSPRTAPTRRFIDAGAAPRQPRHSHSRRGTRALLPVEIVEQVSRDDIGQPGVAAHQEPEEVQQVVGVGADSRRGEATGAQMGEELIDEFDVASRGGALT